MGGMAGMKGNPNLAAMQKKMQAGGGGGFPGAGGMNMGLDVSITLFAFLTAIGVGTASILTRRVAPSAVPLNFGSNLVARTVSKLLFGTPRPLTLEEIRGPEGIIAQFANAASYAHKAGFKGVELHAAHGYLLAQFMSPATNKRTDDYGGTPAARVRIVVEIIRAVRAATSPSFTIGIKLNSVDASQSESAEDIVSQVGLIIAAGIDFIEVSGGTYENPTMSGYKHDAGPTGEHASISATTGVKPSAKKREAYFLEFTALLREHFPKTVLMVIGGFRSRAGMQEAIDSGACDIVGIARPATVEPHFPKKIILNADVKDEQATFVGRHAEPPRPWWMDWIPIAAVHGSWTTIYYSWQLQKIGR